MFLGLRLVIDDLATSRRTADKDRLDTLQDVVHACEVGSYLIFHTCHATCHRPAYSQWLTPSRFGQGGVDHSTACPRPRTPQRFSRKPLSSVYGLSIRPLTRHPTPASWSPV